MTHRRRRRVLTALPVAALCAAAALTAVAAPSASAASSAYATAAGQSYNGTALTPPMGWNDWYQYRCGITENEVLANAHALVSSGLAQLGYNYVNLDDCWMARTRAADGQLQASPTRFPHGIAWLAAQIHAMGLKLGVYESFGDTTCQGRPGSYGHYQQDANTFANWGVDFLKFDYCGVPPGTTSASLQADYTQMSQDLKATGRPIVFSEELPIAAGDANPSNPNYLPYVSLSSQISNMWRVAPDENTNFATTVFGHLADDLPLAKYAHPGAWNDLDMLMAGSSTFNWTLQQQRTQMSIWAELASPLLVSSDLTTMSAATRQLLGNKAVIAVDQDPLGRQGQLVARQNGVDVVAKPLAGGDVAVLLANTTSVPQQITTTAQAVGLPFADAYAVRDLWANTTRESAGTIGATVPAYSALLYRVSPLADTGVGLYQPVTVTSASPEVPPVYAGSQYSIARPGQTITVPATFRNDGRAAVSDASLSLTAPAGWTVSGAPASAGAVPGGGILSGTWQVTVPPGTPTGTYTVTATAGYTWSGTHTASDSGPGGFQVDVPPTGTPYLDQLSWLSATSSFHNSVIIDKNYFGGPLSIHGVTYPHGLWINSIGDIVYYLGGNCSRFTADLGIDDSVRGQGAVDYQFYADGQKIYDSGVVSNSTPTVHADVNVSGVQILDLHVAEGNGTIQFGNADFGNPQLTCTG
ncbi:MAG: NPCBM/NEW2 domain-containing protein [Streptosporangiaceae bacterium]